MALSVVDLYRKVLPRTNCGDCGFPTCLAFASMVVSEKLPLANCPHLSPEAVARCQPELDAQHAAGKWVKKDPAAEALQWARQRAASLHIEELSQRIGGELKREGGHLLLELPYFDGRIQVRSGGMTSTSGDELDRWEQTFLYNHLAQGGSAAPSGTWKSFEELPNTISKVKSMRAHVEEPIRRRFSGRKEALASAGKAFGGAEAGGDFPEADVALRFAALPRVPLLLLFWDAEPAEEIGARAKLLFDETVTVHLDIESILFLSEHLRRRLCGEDP
ncbi:MAG: DUF3786 domain-containing protein [Desulfobacterales bacterium]|nr:DUF3786 domain-containing protein [Desulfobacterales bacterium]